MILNRLDFLVGAVAAGTTVTLPFQNGTRPLVTFPQKSRLILLTPRPPQLETPFAVFDRSVLTPNDAFFVRWHLAGIPTTVNGATHRIRVHGKVKHPLSLSVEDLRTSFEPHEIVAVNQCSGNSRGFFSPRVPGGQWANGAMGNARWKGARLNDILARAGLEKGVVQVRFHGLEEPILPTTPPFIKALTIEDISDDVLVAYEMNGEPLPLLNGYPVRLVVPGWYATYWMKMLADIEAIDRVDDNFWMKTAYRIPQTPGNTVAPTDTGYPTVPINVMTVRSFVTNITDGQKLRAGAQAIRGIAFDRGTGIKKVEFSTDGGASWRDAALGANYGAYSFRPWETSFTAKAGMSYVLACRATANSGETQTTVPVWNPGGYLRNVIETYKVHVS
ncbi:MAG TPA: molybdopterin-dependent oxidoreductase [Candidatus Acidoferrales bacterium]|nr:molybdopterin-dependent oxidoreductase [Candidatus Acidoferrales bacterium]